MHAVHLPVLYPGGGAFYACMHAFLSIMHALILLLFFGGFLCMRMHAGGE